MKTEYDILIVGGGMVGASLACALAGQGLGIGIVEAVPFAAGSHPGYDDRTLALSYGTRRIFEGLRLWHTLGGAATPILRIHISDQGSFGFARLDCREEGVEALGYVIAARELGAVLLRRLDPLEGVDLLCPASLEDLSIHPDGARASVRIDDTIIELSARLLVAADGARSKVRERLGIDAIRWNYDQTAVIANLSPEFPHNNVAYERFTTAGPLALLPMSENRCAAICTVDRTRANGILKLDDAVFSGWLQERFGERLGRFLKVGRRQAFPLFLLKSREHARFRVAVVGNAAHTLHPIAGQGFNLGIRDVAVLAEVVADAVHNQHDIGERAVLERYAAWRRWDQRRTIAFTDGLARLFSNPVGPVRLARNLGLTAFDLCPPAKHLLARQTLGLWGYLPRLARGLPVTGGRA